VIRANVRLPELAAGDLNAGIAAVRIGEARVSEACERYGLATVRAAFEATIEHGERIARAELARIPNGVYRAEDVIDGDGLTDADLPIRVAVTVQDGTMTIDFTGCAPAARGPVNCTTGALHSACKTVIRAITSPGARSNDGFFRPVTITIAPGTVFSAESPSPTGWYYEASAFATELVWKALAPVVSERLGAGSYTSLSVSYIVGTDARDGSLFVHAEPNVGGWGADADGDGENALIATTDGDTYNYPVEVVETRFPVLVERYALDVAGGGAGAHRGGLGCVREYRILEEATGVSGYGSMGGWRRRPWGLGGGSPGTNNVLEYRRGGELRLRHGRVPHIDLEPGDLVTVVTGGGGGYGDPLTRDPERVLADVLDGYVTPDQALADYGVVIGSDRRVDTVATREERGRR
jgi:N-methylhydantoinase B